MPYRPKPPCPDCGRRTKRGGRCPEHRRARAQRYDATRPSAARRGYDRRHRRWRKRVLATWPLCVGHPLGECGRHTSTVADHVVPIAAIGEGLAATRDLVLERLGADALQELDQALAWQLWVRFSLLNGRGMCASCHGKKTVELDGRWEPKP